MDIKDSADLFALKVSVYRDPTMPDATNGGVSFHNTTLIVVDGAPEKVQEYYSKLSDAEKALVLIPEYISSGIFESKNKHLCLQPYALTKANKWLMFGGNFVFTHDSRFRQRISQQPVAIHDRMEW